MRRHELQIHVTDLADVLARAYDLAVFDVSRVPGAGRDTARAPGSQRGALDMRLPLSRSELLKPIALAMVADLADAGVTQVAAYGFGAFSLAGAIVGLGPGFTGALIRESAKDHGRRLLIEGDIRRDERVIVVDDLLCAGRSALRATTALRADGFTVTGVFTVFRFAGLAGRQALREVGLGHRCLATLRRAPAVRPSLPPAAAASHAS